MTYRQKENEFKPSKPCGEHQIREQVSLHVSSQTGGGIVVENPPTNTGEARDVDSMSWSGRSPEIENGNPPQYSCLENFMDRGAWWATLHEVTKSLTQLSR